MSNWRVVAALAVFLQATYAYAAAASQPAREDTANADK